MKGFSEFARAGQSTQKFFMALVQSAMNKETPATEAGKALTRASELAKERGLSLNEAIKQCLRPSSLDEQSGE